MIKQFWLGNWYVLYQYDIIAVKCSLPIFNQCGIMGCYHDKKKYIYPNCDIACKYVIRPSGYYVVEMCDVTLWSVD